ncbi:hypothetical protein DV515_00019604 [Chloebia gouldiae]|uniref:PH domain-containing protein n=1 Tax=Chloebia gouldiae TaxID=44316 RepID=A0A3L8Q488_CHLGU|nr:hypothetical protein DV515_00019604 [Chloebia gouldiae]
MGALVPPIVIFLCPPDSSEQQVRGGLPLPGYEIRVLPAAPRAPRAPQFLFTAEHAGMRTYCLGAETPEELHAWVCALRRGASPLPGSARSLSQQALQEPRGADPPSPPLPTHSPGEGRGGTLVPPPCCSPVPPLPHSEVRSGVGGELKWGEIREEQVLG